MYLCWYIDVCIFVSPCVGGSIVPPRTLYCIKYLLAGVYLSAKPHRLISIHSHHKLHSGDTNYIKHAQIRYVYAIKHSPSGATRPRVSCFIAYTFLLGMLYLIHTACLCPNLISRSVHFYATLYLHQNILLVSCHSLLLSGSVL